MLNLTTNNHGIANPDKVRNAVMTCVWRLQQGPALLHKSSFEPWPVVAGLDAGGIRVHVMNVEF